MDSKQLSSRLREMAVNTGTLNCLGCGYENSCGTRGCAVMKEAAEIVESAPEWISVKDKLPESGSVLITDGVIVVAAPSDTVRNNKHITYWMPIPVPPGKEHRDV